MVNITILFILNLCYNSEWVVGLIHSSFFESISSYSFYWSCVQCSLTFILHQVRNDNWCQIHDIPNFPYNTKKMLCPQHFYNTFTTNLKLSQQILNGRLLLIVMGCQKSNLSCEFILKPIVTYCLWVVVKIL